MQMTLSTRDGVPSRLPPDSTNSSSALAASDASVFSWKRLLKGLIFGLSICWLLLFLISGAAMDPSHTPLCAKAINTVITIAAVLAILFVSRGRSRYMLAALFILTITWVLWNYWIHVECITGS